MSGRTGVRIEMVNGPVIGRIFAFVIPLILSGILQQSFSAVDVAVVGRFCGAKAMAAVGSNGPLINIFLNLFIGVSIGANVIIGTYIGCRDNDRIRRAVDTVMGVALTSGVILLIAGLLFARPMLELMDVPADVLELATEYLQIYFLGMPFLMVYNYGAAILRSMGDTRRPFYSLAISGVINVALNLLLVLVFNLGVSGVAIATVASNAVNAALVVFWLSREEEPFRIHYRRIRFVGSELRKMLSIGVPAGVQGMVFSFSNIFIQTAINGYGADAMAGSAAALNFEMYVYFIISSFAQAAVAFVSQNYGAGNLERCRKVTRTCLLFSLILAGVCNALITWRGQFFISIFSDDPSVIEYGIVRLQVVLLWQWIASSYEITGAAMRGLGKSLTPTVLTVFGTCILRLAWVFLVMKKNWDFDTLLSIYPVTWIATGVMTIAAYLYLMRKLEKSKESHTTVRILKKA